MQIRGKAMADRSGDLLELFHDVLLEARLDDRERFRQVSCVLRLVVCAPVKASYTPSFHLLMWMLPLVLAVAANLPGLAVSG